MLISQKHNFIFIHIYKNAGASITAALTPFATDQFQKLIRVLCRGRLWDKIKTNYKLNSRPYHDHIRAHEMVEKLGKDVYSSFFSFAIVRNPWDWQVSLYSYMLKNTSHYQHELAKNFRDFKEYIYWRCTEEVRLQKDFIYSTDGELLVDFIGRFENIDNDFQYICNEIGISASLPRLNVSNTMPYQQFYDEETKNLVKQTFAQDIKLFKYDFE